MFWDVVEQQAAALGFVGRAEVILKLHVFRRGRELLWLLMNIEQLWRLGRWESLQGGWGRMGDSGGVHQRLRRWKKLAYMEKTLLFHE